MEDYTTWRNELVPDISYVRKFAYWPVTCKDGTRVWMKPYYQQYLSWYRRYGAFGGTRIRPRDDDGVHVDKAEKITEDEYLFRLVSEDI